MLCKVCLAKAGGEGPVYTHVNKPKSVVNKVPISLFSLRHMLD